MKDLGLKWHVLGKLTIIYILVFACAIIPVTASKYVSQAEGSSSARVARFEVTSNCTYDAETKEYILTITNNSEVTVLYDISYTVDSSPLPKGVTITFEQSNNGTLKHGATISGKLVFSENYESCHEESIIDVIVTASQVD